MIPSVSTLELAQLASGDRLSLEIYKFIGQTPGKKAYLQSNLHGSEIVGNAVIYQLIEWLSSLEETQLAGEIWLVPVCNPLGTNQRTHFFSTGRFNSYDGRDWNRIFWDYEKECFDLEEFAKSQLEFEAESIQENYLKRIKAAFQTKINELYKPSSAPFRDQYRCQLQALCLDANYVIDIHSSSNQGMDYLYCFESRKESAKAFLLDWAISMTEYDGDAFDEAFMKPWLALEAKLKELGKPVQFEVESWTLELGSGMQMNPESVQKGVRGIKNYLAARGMLKLPGFPCPETATHSMNFVSREQVKRYYAPVGGMIQSRVPLGSKVEAGQRVYQLLQFKQTKKQPIVTEICAEVAGVVFDLSTNQAVNQGEYVLSIVEAN